MQQKAHYRFTCYFLYRFDIKRLPGRRLHKEENARKFEKRVYRFFTEFAAIANCYSCCDLVEVGRVSETRLVLNKSY